MKTSFFNISTIVGFIFLANFFQPATKHLPATETVQGSCSLPAPATFSAQIVSTSSVALSWTAVSGASSYLVKVYALNGPTAVYIGESVESGLSVTKNGLNTENAYRFVLASMCSANSVSDFVIMSDTNP